MKIYRPLLILLGLLVLLAVAAPLAGAYILRRYVDRDFLVLETEKNINARVQLDDVTLTLFTWPPSLRLSGMKFAPRDAFAGTPLATRPPLGDAPVSIEMAYAELFPEELLHGRFLPSVIRFIGVDVRESVSAHEGSSLEKLFARPGGEVRVAEAEVPRAVPLQPVASAPAETVQPAAPAMPAEPPPSSSADRLSLKEITIEQARFRISNQGSDSRFDGEISDFNLAITNIDVDPTDLARHNHLDIHFSSKAVLDGQAKIGGRMQQVRFADVKFEGEGDVAPVNPATMQWSPAAMLKVKIAQGSVLGGHMTIGDAAGDHLDKLKKYGVDLSGIRIGGPLTQELDIHVLAREQDIRFLDDAHLALPDYEVTVKRESWMDFARDDQGLLTRLYCGQALKDQVVRGVSGRGLGDNISRMIVDGLSDAQGRLAFDLTVTGSLSHPEVKPDVQVKLEKLLGSDIEQQAKGLINTFKGLKGLFK